MLKFLFRVLVVVQMLDEAIEVKVQPRFGWFSYLLWYFFSHKFTLACYWEGLCLVKCTNLKDLPVTIRTSYKGNVNESEIKVTIE